MSLNKASVGRGCANYIRGCARGALDFSGRRFCTAGKNARPSRGLAPLVPQATPAPSFNRRSVRFYGNVGSDWLPKRNQYTKYRITKPWTSDSSFDDIFLAEPSKDDFYPFTKEMPVFLKFLNLLTTAQKRKDAFINFVKRCENGLVVEKDVYLTKDELLECMWANGYSEQEMNAFKFAFPADYRFHYPGNARQRAELAVLFELEEEECYKYCVKERASNPEELVELKLKKPTNLVSSYGLVFLGCWFALSNAVLGNAWFFAKTLPFGAVFYLLASYFQKWLKEYFWKEENALIEKARQEKDYCEEAIYAQLRSRPGTRAEYLEDSKCVEYVESFKAEVVARMEQYRRALLLRMKGEAAALMRDRLNQMANQEAAILASLEKVGHAHAQTMVSELVRLFLETFSASPEMKTAALSAAVDELRGEYSRAADPLFSFFDSNLGEFQAEGSASSFVARCNRVFEQKEQEFLNAFTVTWVPVKLRRDEHDELAKLARACRAGQGFNLGKLSDAQRARLDQMYHTLSHRLGYYVPALPAGATQYADPEVDSEVGGGNAQLADKLELLRSARMTEFLRQFA